MRKSRENGSFFSLLNCKCVSEKTRKSQKTQNDKRKVSDNYDKKRRTAFV